jgi:oxygen-dependent protoporphyrinogen oxidase
LPSLCVVGSLGQGSHDKKVVIAGAGISGLTLAYLLSQQNADWDITVLESQSRPGGKIGSERIRGFLCEQGPGGFLDNKSKTLELCNSLGLTPLRSNENAKKRYLFSKGKLNLLPDSPPAFLKSNILSWRAKLRMAAEPFVPRGPEEETVAQFVAHRLGKEALEQLIDPMVSGVFAGDPHTMSVSSAFPRIKELEQQYGSLIKALIKIRSQRKREQGAQAAAKVNANPGGTLTSFAEGVQTLTDRLANELGERIKIQQAVQGINKVAQRYQIICDKATYEADILIVATPAYSTAELLKDMDQSLAQLVAEIPYPHVSVVCLGYRKNNVKHPLNGFGFLIPHKEQRRILGTLWDSSIFANRAAEDSVLLRTMVGGAQFPEMAELQAGQVQDIVMAELTAILGLRGEPEVAQVYQWPRAIPQYLVGHKARLEAIDKRLQAFPGLYLTGNAYHGIGMNDCIANAYELAHTICDSFST